MKRQLAQRMRGETCESVTHLVAKVFRARMAAGLDPDAVVEHHPTLTSAMENFCLGELRYDPLFRHGYDVKIVGLTSFQLMFFTGDVIHIHEGVYSGVSLRSTPSGTVIRGKDPNWLFIPKCHQHGPRFAVNKMVIKIVKK